MSLLLQFTSNTTMLIHHKIAVVDDESELAIMYAEAIRTQGYAVKSFSDPVLALQEICSNPFEYNLVITDIKMAVMNGMELATQIQYKNNKIKIIFISGYGQFDASDLKFTLLTKPIRINKFLEVVNNILGAKNRADNVKGFADDQLQNSM